MRLYIQVRNNQPYEHPIFEENLLQVFPDIDLNNLPNNFARFERIEGPALGVYEVYEGVTYEKEGEFYKDVHHVRPMTNEEKTNKQNQVKQSWLENGYPSWVFDEETCSFKPPVPRPEGEGMYYWNEPTTEWLLYNQEKQI